MKKFLHWLNLSLTSLFFSLSASLLLFLLLSLGYQPAFSFLLFPFLCPLVAYCITVHFSSMFSEACFLRICNMSDSERIFVNRVGFLTWNHWQCESKQIYSLGLCKVTGAESGVILCMMRNRKEVYPCDLVGFIATWMRQRLFQMDSGNTSISVCPESILEVEARGLMQN